MTWRVRGLQSSPKAPILIIAFAVVLLALASLVVASAVSAERGFATAKDPASNTISRGWCRLMGLAPLMLFTATVLIVRNQRIITAWNARQAKNARRAAGGLPPRTRRRRRRTTLNSLAATTAPP